MKTSVENFKCEYSVYQMFLRSVERFGARPFLRVPASSTRDYCDETDSAIEYSYDSAKQAVFELIGAYRLRDLQKGDRVVVCFDSRLDVYLHLLALNALGVSMVPIVSTASDDELLHIIGHSDSRLLVTMQSQYQRLRDLVRGSLNCAVVGSDEIKTAGSDAKLPEVGQQTEAAMLYTSGTTGKPKGCMLSNEYFTAIGRWYVGLGGICSLDEHDRLLTPLPPNHMNALCCSFMAMMCCGGCVIQVDRFHPRSWWKTVREEQATVIHCLGVMTAILLTLPESEQDNFGGQIKFCFGPGSDPKHQGVFEKRFGFPLVEAWAMTESGAGAMTIAYEEPRHVGERCIGKPLGTMDYRIVDEKDIGVANGEPGELLVRAKGDSPRQRFFSGYYKDREATEEGWRGGWWHTGDVVREGDDGNLFFVDRRKNVIRRSGENIAAVEVEAVLLQHPAVSNCAVCAVPDEIRGDEVFAFAIVSDTVDAKSLFEHCMRRLTYFKAPGYIAFVEELPLTGSQKLRRGDVKQMARDRVAAGECTDLRALKKRRVA